MFAELVCGPPGCGKTTYCEGKRQFLSVYDPQRPVVIVNLDPANEGVFPYPCDIDVRELIAHSEVMDSEGLGPNGTYLFCIEYIAEHLDWLERKICEIVNSKRAGEAADFSMEPMAVGRGEQQQQQRAPHLLFDCPGQVEFYLNAEAMHKLTKMLAKSKLLKCNVCVVHLTDASVATRDVGTYVSTCLLSLSCMVDLELPHINVMSKWDLAMEVADDPDDLVAYLETPNFLDDHFLRLWKKMERGREARRGGTEEESHYSQTKMFRMAHVLMDVIAGFNLVSFLPLNVQSQEDMTTLTQIIDNAMGNFF